MAQGPARIGPSPAVVMPACGGACVLPIVFGPTTTTTSTTTTTLNVPVGGASDVNCPNTIPTKTNSQTMTSTLTASITCPTPAITTNVISISFWADGTGSAGVHQVCSVYTYPAGYVAGTTAIPKVSDGCDTVAWTSTANFSGWVTLATTGACTLAPSTRYMIACNQDSGFFIGSNNNVCTVGGVQCTQYRGQTFATPFPASWTAGNQFNLAYTFYMTVR